MFQARKPSLTVLKKLVLALIILAAALWLALNAVPLSNYALLYYYGLVFAVAVAFGVMFRGRWRDACVVVAALTVGLSAIELISIHAVARTMNMRQTGSFAPDAALGWGLGKPGVYWQKKIQGGPNGHVIFDVTYTINSHRNRQTVSTEHGPTVAFFGDFMTFGEGIPDEQTLPQAFADLTGRKMHVLNLGVSGYGPQQFLRALELDLDDNLLKGDPRLFVFLTAPWQAERVSCAASFALLGPSYALESGLPVYKGACYQQSGKVLSAIRNALASTSTYQMFFKNVTPSVYRRDIDLYIAVLISSRPACPREIRRSDTCSVPHRLAGLRPPGGHDGSAGHAAAARRRPAGHRRLARPEGLSRPAATNPRRRASNRARQQDSCENGAAGAREFIEGSGQDDKRSGVAGDGRVALAAPNVGSRVWARLSGGRPCGKSRRAWSLPA